MVHGSRPFLGASSARYGMWGHDATTQGGEPLHLIYRWERPNEPGDPFPLKKSPGLRAWLLLIVPGKPGRALKRSEHE